MLLEIFSAILLGILAGIVTGLVPGIHINLVAVFLLGLAPLLLEYFQPLTLAVFIVSMSVNHTFLDTIPSIFLGAPDPDVALSILPGHQLLLEGKGYEAVALTIIGSFFSLIIALMLTPAIIFISKYGYPLIQDKIGWILIIACSLLILKERGSKLLALVLFFLSGTLGVAILNSPIKDPLFPLFSGLFGISSLILSLNSKTDLPLQEITFPVLEKFQTIKSLALSIITGICSAFTPGLGPSQAAALSTTFFKNLKSKYFLIIIGGLSTINMVVSFIALYTINKSRNGSVIAISKLIQTLTFKDLILLLSITLFVAGIATILALSITKVFSKFVEKIDYKKLCITIILLITTLTFIFSGPLGLLILTTSTLLGMIPQTSTVQRHHLMGCLLLPVILFFIL